MVTAIAMAMVILSDNLTIYRPINPRMFRCLSGSTLLEMRSELGQLSSSSSFDTKTARQVLPSARISLENVKARVSAQGANIAKCAESRTRFRRQSSIDDL